MTINIKLSEGSINAAISKLNHVKENIDYGLGETVEILAKDGAAVANGYYGGMANASEFRNADLSASIQVTGEAPYIAEFGAGDATLSPMFENYVGVDVYPGSYSEQVGTKEYATTGRWHFGGQVFTAVEPRSGLLNAKYYIIDNAARVAREVIKL